MLGLILIIFLVIYFYLYRPWQLRWGATDEEVDCCMQGDDIVTNPSFNSTRAVTVEISPQYIWPWLVQIGCNRAGWYSYSWIDNRGMPSAERIIPELQHFEVGQFIPFSFNGKMGMYVKDFETNYWMLWGDKDNLSSWCWGLYPIDFETYAVGFSSALPL